MKSPTSPPDETRRLESLRRYELLDTLPEQALDDLTALAAHICEAPISLISLVDEKRQWFKSKTGLAASETPRDVSFCAHALHQADLFIVPDATTDERFADNPLVTGDPSIRFYAGAPLLTPEGQALGTLCVIDRVPRQLTESQEQALRVLSRQVMAHLELRRQTRELAARERLLQGIFDSEPECVKLVGPDGSLRMMNRAGLQMIEADSFAEVANHSIYPLVVSEHRAEFQALTERVFRGESGILEFRIVGLKGAVRWLETNATPLRDEDGEVTALLGITRDVTARRQIEQASRESERRISTMFNASPAAICVNTVDAGRVIDINEQFIQFTGFTREELIGRTVLDLKLWADPEARQSVMSRLKTDGAVRDVEAQFRRKNGEVRDVLVSCELVELMGESAPVTISMFLDVTERKRAEEALRASEANMAAAQRISHFGSWELDLANRDDASDLPLRWSDEMFRIAGYEPGAVQITRELFFGIVHPEDRDLVRQAVAKAIHERGTYSIVHRFILPDGEVRLVQQTAQIIFDEQTGQALKIVGTTHDITERERTERQLAALVTLGRRLGGAATAAEAARIIVETADDLFGWDACWLHLYDKVMDRFRSVLNMDVVDGRRENVPPTYADRPPSPFARRAISEGPQLILREHPALGVSGLIPFGDTARPSASIMIVPVRHGEELIAVLSIQSYTVNAYRQENLVALEALADQCGGALVQMRAREALRESEERFREVAETIREVFWIIDPAKNQMLYVSPAYEEIWGRSCQSLYDSSRTWVEAVHPDDRERVRQAAMTKQPRGDYDETYRIQRPDGTTRWIHDRAFPVRGENGEVVRVVGTAEDITERRQLQEQFLQSQKLEAIGQLAGGVAHDFNNILTVIQGYGSLLMMSDQSLSERKDAVEQIVRASEQAANLTRQLLAFSRRQVMQTRVLDLNEIVTSLTKMLQRLVGEDVHLQLNLHPHALLTRADAGMIDQVLLNLVVNARDAMPGGGRLFIETNEQTFTAEEAASVVEASPGRYVSLSVTDTGSGMTPEILPRIFEPFFTTKELGKGTGLGLATVFGIVKQHGGALTVQSEAGKGTTFQVFLRAEQVTGKSLEGNAAKPKPRGGTETILLVEDDPGVRLLTRSVLEQSGYQVLEAPNGIVALKIWEQHQDRIQLLFTDIVMPEGLSGFELAVRLQTRNPRLRVIFTSGYSADIAGRELTLQEGQNFIQKPSAPLLLLETVRRSLDD